MTTAESVRKIISTFGAVDVASLADSAVLAEIGLDSLDMAEIVIALEEEFEFKLPDEAVEQISTVGDAVRYIEQHAPRRIRRARQRAVRKRAPPHG
jgi:acyl carrier protein